MSLILKFCENIVLNKQVSIHFQIDNFCDLSELVNWKTDHHAVSDGWPIVFVVVQLNLTNQRLICISSLEIGAHI